MSMRNNAVSTYGLYVLRKDLEPYATSKDMDVYDVADEMSADYYYDVEGELIPIKPNIIYPVWSSALYSPEEFWIAEVKKFPSLFTRQYANYSEALQELKDSYAQYLPEDFDYEGRFVYCTGVIHG